MEWQGYFSSYSWLENPPITDEHFELWNHDALFHFMFCQRVTIADDLFAIRIIFYKCENNNNHLTISPYRMGIPCEHWMLPINLPSLKYIEWTHSIVQRNLRTLLGNNSSFEEKKIKINQKSGETRNIKMNRTIQMFECRK